MTNPNPQSKEAQERLKQQPGLTTEQLSRASQEVMKKDVNAPYTRAMANADIVNPAKEDIEGLTFMQSEIINIMTKIAKKHPKANLSKLKPENLAETANKSGIKLRNSEIIALNKLREVRSNKTSRTNRELQVHWNEWIKEAESAKEGFGKKYLRRLKKNPVETIVYTVAGATGIYLGLKALGWLFNKSKEKVSSKIKEKASSIFGTGNVLGMLGLGALGVYMGRHSLENWIYETFGVRFGAKKTKEMLNQIQKGKIPPELVALQKKAEDAKAKGGIAGAIQGVKERLTPTREEKETSERHEQYSEFIEGKNPKLKVKALLFSYIGEQDYETFLSESKSSIEKVISIVEDAIGIKEGEGDTKEKAKELLIGYGAIDLISFFKEMLKEKNHKDFKGKTIRQVMEMILKKPEEYIDEEAVAEANTKNEHLEELKKMMDKENIGEILSGNTEFASTFFKHATLAGVTFAIDKAQNGIVWIVERGVDAVMWESEVVYKTIKKIADRAMESDNGWIWGTGAYLQVGAYTAAIGAPIGTVAGFGKSMIRNPLAIGQAAIHGGLGGWRGIKAGLKMPGKLVLGTMWDIVDGKFHPIQDFKSAIDQQRFIFEDLSVGKIGQIGKWKTLTQKIASGEVELSDDLIWRLKTYSTIAKKRVVEMEGMSSRKSKISGRGYYSKKAGSYEKMSEEIKKILKLANAEGNGIDPDKWRTAMSKVAKDYGIDDSKFLSNINEIKGASRSAQLRIGSLLLFNPEHSFSKLIASNPQRANELFKLFDTNQEILEAIVKNPNLINDFRILNAIEKLDAKTSSTFAELFVERATIWKGMRKGELRILSANPEIISSYTRLTESIQNPKRSVEWVMEAAAKRKGMGLEAFKKTDEGKKALDFAKRSLDKIGIQNRLLQKIMLHPNTRQAQFIYRHIDDLDILFENTANGQKAVDHFLAIDNQVLKLMQKKGVLGQLSEHFKNFNARQGEIVEMVARYESEVGKIGRMAQKLGQMKAGLYEKIGESTEEIAKKSKEAMRRFRGVRLTASHIDELSKIKDFNQVKGILNNQGIEVEKWAIRAIAETDDLDKIKVILRKATQQSGQYVRFVRGAEIGAKAIRILKPAAAFTFGVAAFAGAGIDFYNAASTDNKKKGNLYLQKGGISSMAGAAEVGTMIVAGAASGAAAAVGFAAAPIVYMTDTAYESALEHETEPKEWAQTYDYETLMHHWTSTGKMLSAGDSYRAFFTTDTVDSIMLEHKDIKGSIVKALILTEGERFEREGEYRAKYMEVVHDFNPMHEDHAKEILHRSRLFAEAIQKRSQLKEQGVKSFQIREMDLMSDEFEFENWTHGTMIKLEVNWKLFTDKEAVHPLLVQNFEQMENGELLDYYWQLNKYINQNQETITDNETYFRDQIENYLFYARKIEANKACETKWARAVREEMLAMGEIPEDPEKLKQAQEKAVAKVMKNFDEAAVLRMMAEIEGGQPLHFESTTKKITNNEACYALYQLAKTFGYIGIQNEEELKGFFNEERKGSLGIYWDGENWFVNEAGYEFDDEIGKELNRHTIEKFIQELRDKPDDRLEHRQDAVAFGMGEIFEYKVLKMAEILEKSLGEYNEQHKKESVEMPLEERLVS